MGATSIAMLRPYAGGGSGPRDPLGRRSTTPFCRIHPQPIVVRRQQRRNELREVSVRRVGWRRTAGSASRKSIASIRRPPSAKFVLGRATRSQFKRTKPELFRVEAGSKRRCASLRDGRLRPARLCESQKLGPMRWENRIRFSHPKNKHGPKLAPILRPVSASLRLRWRRSALESWACLLLNVARGNSYRIGRVPTGRICPLKRAGDGIFARSFRRGAVELCPA